MSSNYFGIANCVYTKILNLIFFLSPTASALAGKGNIDAIPRCTCILYTLLYNFLDSTAISHHCVFDRGGSLKFSEDQYLYNAGYNLLQNC